MTVAIVLVSVIAAGSIAGIVAAGRTPPLQILTVVGTAGSFLAAVVLWGWESRIARHFDLGDEFSRSTVMWGTFAILALAWLGGLAFGVLIRTRASARRGASRASRQGG